MSSNLDFDYLSELFTTDPEKFEAFRLKEIEKVISGASGRDQKRMRGIQFKIDAKREIHKDSPLGACIAISKMMHESFENLRYHLNKVSDYKDPLNYQPLQYKATDFSEENSGKVLQFREP